MFQESYSSLAQIDIPNILLLTSLLLRKFSRSQREFSSWKRICPTSLIFCLICWSMFVCNPIPDPGLYIALNQFSTGAIYMFGVYVCNAERMRPFCKAGVLDMVIMPLVVRVEETQFQDLTGFKIK